MSRVVLASGPNLGLHFCQPALGLVRARKLEPSIDPHVGGTQIA